MEKKFINKNIMILVPHQDDELNICGGMLTSGYFNLDKITIVFSTNGDYSCNYLARRKETEKIIKKLKMKDNQIIYMGYPDQFSREDDHLYLVHNPNYFTSKKGNSKTFSNNYHLTKYNKNCYLNHENFVNDIEEIITEKKPEIIFTIDFDSHPDHRALSLSFEEAIGKILKKYKNYKPDIYKAFAYPTYYKGINDFNCKTSQLTKFLTEDYSLCKMQNPYYNFEERISFKVNNERLLLFNKMYKLLKIYRSQLIIKRSYSILNDDVIFFKRRTDNLLYDAKIYVSSGNKDYLNDFMLFDISTITHGNTQKPKLKNSAFIFDDKDENKEIKIAFKKEFNIKELVLYQNLYDESRIEEIELKIKNKTKKYKINNNKETIYLNENSKNIQIKVIKTKGKNAGFTEIELFETKTVNDIIESNDIKKDSIILKIINNIVLSIDVFWSRVLNKIDRIRGKL